MRVTYFIASNFDYSQVIYPGVGAPFARALGWPVEPISQLGRGDFDIAVIDPRVQREDVPYLSIYLDKPLAKRRPVFFKITDPDTPLSRRFAQRFVFDQANRPGVHYASAYDPAGPLVPFVQSLTSSRVAPLPFVYDQSREVDRPMQSRRRKVLMSGAVSRRVYPLRHRLIWSRRLHPLAFLSVDRLKHPRYPDIGQRQRHAVTHDRFISKAAGYTHLFMCPSVYSVELMKYVECAYAGCVPIGLPPNSLARVVKDSFVTWERGAGDLWKSVRIDSLEASERASAYRTSMRALRDPARVVAEFEDIARGVA